jgi:hypothetical protein
VTPAGLDSLTLVGVVLPEPVRSIFALPLRLRHDAAHVVKCHPGSPLSSSYRVFAKRIVRRSKPVRSRECKSHTGKTQPVIRPESCGGGRKAVGEALTGAHAGQPSSCEITLSGVRFLPAHRH